MTNVEALKNLYVALGGSADDVANLDSNAAIINILGNVAGSGGSGGGGLVVNANASGTTVILDKTFAEIESAMMAGRPVVIVTIVGEAKSTEVVKATMADSTGYRVETGSDTPFTASGPNDYPVYSME